MEPVAELVIWSKTFRLQLVEGPLIPRLSVQPISLAFQI